MFLCIGRLMNNKLLMACYIRWDSENMPSFLRLRKYVILLSDLLYLQAYYGFEPC